MKRKIMWVVASCLMVLSLILSSCAPAVTEEEETIAPAEEEVATEEEEALPANFVATNLQAVEAPELGECCYRITVNVENIGGCQGIYQLRCQVDNQEVEVAEVKLSPGEKTTLILSETEAAIKSLALKYKSRTTYQKEHVVSIEGLSQKVTFPEPPPPKTVYKPPPEPAPEPKKEPAPKITDKIKVLWQQGYIIDERSFTVVGEVENISDESLKDVEAVALFLDPNGKVIKMSSSLIRINPLPPGKTSKFDVTITTEEPMTGTGYKYILSFRLLPSDENSEETEETTE